MIDLTPLEVRQKKGDFRRSFRGYDPELVNDFLDLVADRMEELVKENMTLREAAESGEGELERYREKERALSDALMTAQKLRDDARQSAEKEAELMLREAQLRAESLRDEMARQLVREQDALRNVRARRAQLVESFRRLLDREMSELDVIEETLELEGTVKESPPAPERSGGVAREPKAREEPEPLGEPEPLEEPESLGELEPLDEFEPTQGVPEAKSKRAWPGGTAAEEQPLPGLEPDAGAGSRESGEDEDEDPSQKDWFKKLTEE